MVLKHAGCTIRYQLQEVPWKRQLSWIKTGQSDFVTGASKTLERERYALFSLPYRDETVALFVRKTDEFKFSIHSLRDIPGSGIKRLGVYRGSYYGEEFARLSKQAKFIPYLYIADSEQQNLERLIMHRLDAVLMDVVSGVAMIKAAGLKSKLVQHPKIRIKTGTIHVMFSKSSVSTSMVEAFNQSLQKLKTHPEFQALFDKYR